MKIFLRALLNLPFACFYFLYSLLQLTVLAFIPKRKFTEIYTKLDRNECDRRCKSMEPYLKPEMKILDVGSGSGRFGKVLKDRYQVDVVGVDVVDYADAQIPFFKYNGSELPFPDKSFDVVFAAFVLHHCETHDVLMKEMVRVARNKVIVFEDSFYAPWERVFTMWNDFHTNILQGAIKVLKGYARPGVTDMPMPLTFRSVGGWKRFFKKFPVVLKGLDQRVTSYKPLRKVTFCLERT